MSYAKKNIRDVEDSAVKFGLTETQEARFARSEMGAKPLDAVEFANVSGLKEVSIGPNCRLNEG